MPYKDQDEVVMKGCTGGQAANTTTVDGAIRMLCDCTDILEKTVVQLQEALIPVRCRVPREIPDKPVPVNAVEACPVASDINSIHDRQKALDVSLRELIASLRLS